MYQLQASLAATLATTHAAVTRLVILTQDLRVRRTFDLERRIVLDGSVTTDRTRDVRRAASLGLSNKDGSLSPLLADDLLAEGSVVRIETGAMVRDGDQLHVPLVTGFVTGCRVRMSTARIDLVVESFMSALAQEAGEGMTLQAGTTVPDVLQRLWSPVLPWVAWDIDPRTQERTLGSDIPVLPGDDRLQVGMRIATDLGVEVFDDREGAIVVRVRADPTTLAPVRTITLPLDLDREVGRRPVNAQPVEATPGEDETLWVVEHVDDPASPIHRSRIGLRMAPVIRSDSIPDPDTARAVARRWLAARALSQDRATIDLPRRHIDLDEGDVIEAAERITGASGRWIIDSVTYPVVQGQVQASARSVVPLWVEAGQ